MHKAHQDVQSAIDEFKSTVNPDDLRAWVLMQLKKHPQGQDSNEMVQEWPSTFPKFRGSRFTVYLRPLIEGSSPESSQGASLIWDFRGEALKVTILLNPDGTAADFDDHPTWANGIALDHLHK